MVVVTPYYQDSSATIYLGDCREVLAAVADVAATVTSPPYNTLGERIPAQPTGRYAKDGWFAKVTASGYADDMGEAEYAAWQREIAAAVLISSRPGASYFYNHKVRYRDGMVHPLDLVRQFAGWRIKQELIWERTGAVAFNARMFAPSDERIYWLVAPGDHVWNQESAGMLTVWRIHQTSDALHPCPYPLTLPTRCIAAVTQPGDTVLDPFMGSGTTLRAAKNLGRKSIGIEIEERYCEIAAKRLAQEVLDFGVVA